MEPIIKMKNVSKFFGPFQALKSVSLDVAEGERVVVCGPSGSGKSTLIRCINRLEKHEDGAIEVEGIRLDDSPAALDAIRRNVGMVFQQFNLFPHLTAGENVMLAPRVVKKARDNEVRALAEQMLEKVGLAEKFDAYPTELSGGQQQRVAIARALAMQPKVMLCDEITSALDPELVSEVLSVVKQLANEGMTLIMVTHEMRFAREVGDKLVFMHEGRVHEEGPPTALFSSPSTPELAAFIGAITEA